MKRVFGVRGVDARDVFCDTLFRLESGEKCASYMYFYCPPHFFDVSAFHFVFGLANEAIDDGGVGLPELPHI